MDGAYQIGPSVFSHAEHENRIGHERYGLPWIAHPENLETWLAEHAGSLDLVAILTPATDHARHIRDVAARGLPFLCEKPVACSRHEVAEVEAALAATPGIVARFVHNYSGYPLFREMVLRVEDGAIGPIHHIRVNMPSDGFARENITGKPQMWRRNDPEVPMLMLDLGTHMHHLVRMLAGPSHARVSARMHTFVNSFGVVDHAEIWEERSDGIQVSYWMSKAHLGVKNGLSIEAYGRDGALLWHQMDPDHLVYVDTDSNRIVVNRGAVKAEANLRSRFKPGHPTGFVEAFASFYSDLAEDLAAARRGQPGSRWIRPMQDAFDSIEFLSAAARSHDTGQWVEI